MWDRSLPPTLSLCSCSGHTGMRQRCHLENLRSSGPGNQKGQTENYKHPGIGVLSQGRARGAAPNSVYQRLWLRLMHECRTDSRNSAKINLGEQSRLLGESLTSKPSQVVTCSEKESGGSRILIAHDVQNAIQNYKIYEKKKKKKMEYVLKKQENKII